MGPYVRSDIELARSIGTLAHPSTFGHGGAGSPYCWGDPSSGVSFAFLSKPSTPTTCTMRAWTRFPTSCTPPL